MVAKKHKRIVLLDAHAIIHRAYHALPDFSTNAGEPTGALYGLSTMLIKIGQELAPDYVIACFDLPEATHRHEVYEDYKGTRTKTDDALVAQLDTSREVIQAFGIPIYDKPGFEADDILGTIAHELKDAPYEIIIASGDMDTLQLVDGARVKVFTLRKGITDTITYDEKAVKARYGFAPQYVPDYKGLSGDPSDNIPGIAGVGSGTAQKVISAYGGLDALYKALEKDADAVIKKTGVQKRFIQKIIEGRDEAEFSKMLATIRVDAPINFAVPKKEWREGIDTAALTALFDRLEFRTLGARVKALISGEAPAVAQAPKEENKKKTAHDPQKEIEALLMLWLVRSDYTNPTLDDVYTFTKTATLDDAHKALEALIKKHELSYVYEQLEKPLLPVVQKMNETGVAMDVTYLKKLSKEYHAELQTLEKRIYEAAGGEFNINSPKQLGEVLFGTMGLGKGARGKKTSTGQRSTKESELLKLKDEHPIIDDILSYRELAKLLSTYIDSLPMLTKKDGRLYARFVQTGTTTGRIASVEPNVQNIPIRTEHGARIRKAFVAPKQHVLAALDYSQIELRLAAIIANDPKLVAAFTEGLDIHTAVARDVFAVKAEEVTKEMRRRAKVINFGILYGMGVNALRAALGGETTQAEAREFYDHYFTTYGTLAAWLDRTKADAAAHGYVQTLFGRKRFFSGITSHLPFIRAQAERMAINAPIQGTAADIIKRAMIEVDAYITKESLHEKVRMVLQVHDELIFEVHDDVVGAVVPAIQTIMESALRDKETHGVPLVVDVAKGNNWGTLIGS